MAAERQRKPRSGDRHKEPRGGDRHREQTRTWRPRPERFRYEDAIDAATEAAGSLNEYLNLSVMYLLGLRKDPPPRPAWADEKAHEAEDGQAAEPDGPAGQEPPGEI